MGVPPLSSVTVRTIPPDGRMVRHAGSLVFLVDSSVNQELIFLWLH